MKNTKKAKTHIVGPYDEIMCGLAYASLVNVTPDAEVSNCASCVKNLRKRYAYYVRDNETLISVREVSGGFAFRRRGARLGNRAYVCPIFEFTKLSKERMIIRDIHVMDSLEVPHFACETGCLAAEEIERTIRMAFYEKRKTE